MQFQINGEQNKSYVTSVMGQNQRLEIIKIKEVNLTINDIHMY